jgi:hypothetical protein
MSELSLPACTQTPADVLLSQAPPTLLPVDTASMLLNSRTEEHPNKAMELPRNSNTAHLPLSSTARAAMVKLRLLLKVNTGSRVVTSRDTGGSKDILHQAVKEGTAPLLNSKEDPPTFNSSSSGELPPSNSPPRSS